MKIFSVFALLFFGTASGLPVKKFLFSSAIIGTSVFGIPVEPAALERAASNFNSYDGHGLISAVAGKDHPRLTDLVKDQSHQDNILDYLGAECKRQRNGRKSIDGSIVIEEGLNEACSDLGSLLEEISHHEDAAIPDVIVTTMGNSRYYRLRKFLKRFTPKRKTGDTDDIDVTRHHGIPMGSGHNDESTLASEAEDVLS